MDIATKDFSKHTTTIQIPKWLAVEINANGMTLAGALFAGWEAIKEKQDIKEDLEASRTVADRYRQDYKELRAKHLLLERRVSELESKAL